MARISPELLAELEALAREYHERSVSILRRHLNAQAAKRHATPPIEQEPPTDMDRALAARLRRKAGLPANRGSR